MAVFLFIHPLERVKNIRNILLLDPLSCIFHRIPDFHPVHPQPFTANGKGDGTLFRIFHRIIQQINQHLFNTHLIAAEHAGHGRIHMQPKFQSLFPGLYPNHVHNLGKKLPCFIDSIHNLHLTGFNLGQIQYVINERQQHFACPLDIPGILGNVIGNIPPQNHFVQPDNGIDRSADLMAHTGEKMVFSLIELFNLLFLLYGDLVFFFIKMVLEQQNHTCQGSRQNHGTGRIKICLSVSIWQDKLRIMIGHIITHQRLSGTQEEKHQHPLTLQSNTDINETEYKPLRNPAINPPSGKKDYRKQQKQQYYNGRGSHINTFLFNTDLHGHVHIKNASRHDEHICRKSAQNQYKNQSNHADTRNKPEHALSQTGLMIKYDVKPFF